VSVLPVSRAAISVHPDGGGLEVLAATDGIADQIEWTQATLGDGPGVDAVAAGGPQIAADLTARDVRWPVFAAEAVRAGACAMYAFPLQIGAIRVGVLDLYRDRPAELLNVDFADAVAVAEIVSAVLLTSGWIGGFAESLGVLWEQPAAAREIHQATGMVVAQLGVTAREAYVRLQAYAYAHGRLLGDVAHDVVRRRLKFEPDTDPDTDANPLPT
jgi:hypothetical protein